MGTDGFNQDQLWESGRPHSHLVIDLSLPLQLLYKLTALSLSWNDLRNQGGVENQGRFPFLLASRAVVKVCLKLLWELTAKGLGRREPQWSWGAANQTIGLHHQLSRLHRSSSDPVGLPLVLPLNSDWYTSTGPCAPLMRGLLLISSERWSHTVYSYTNWGWSY